jgi:ribosomal protein L11 methyltransferase
VVATGLGHARLRRAPAFDLVVANILAGPLIRLAPALRRRITAHGALVLAGILASQAREVSAVYATAGFGLERRDLSNGWATLTLVRNPDR